MADFVGTLLHAVLVQILGVLGIFFVFGLVLAKLQSETQQLYRRTIGWKGILWTAWIGTPIHELGHIFFAKIFRHKIDHISLFAPNKETGGLGHVAHSYDPKSLYQRIGNFFIGAAPMIFGGIILVVLLFFLVPNGKEIFAPLHTSSSGSLPLFSSLVQTLERLFAPENLRAWNFWVFLYISFAIASHMAPSKQDQKGMWKGFGWLVLLLIILNMIALFIGANLTDVILDINQYLGIFTAIFTYALLLSILHLIIASLLLFPLKKRG